MHTILITGAYGFVGKNLAEHFSEKTGFRLIALDIESSLKKNYSENYTWDNLDSINWENIDTVIHLAGLAHDTKNTLDATKYFDINVGLTKRIFSYFIKSNAKKFIFFSSVKAVADSVKTEFLTEDYLPEPNTPYGKSKLEAENYILSQALPADKKIFILRPCMIHGPGNKGNLNLLYKFIKVGIPYPLGDFENKRSFTSIGNLNFILEKIITHEVSSGIYQVADDEALSTNELIKIIARTLHKKERIWHINQKLIFRLAGIGDFLHLPFNSERLHKLTENYVVSNRKIMEAIGDSLPVSSLDGLNNTLSSFINREGK